MCFVYVMEAVHMLVAVNEINGSRVVWTSWGTDLIFCGSLGIQDLNLINSQLD